jgi:hypothetical protein
MTTVSPNDKCTATPKILETGQDLISSLPVEIQHDIGRKAGGESCRTLRLVNSHWNNVLIEENFTWADTEHEMCSLMVKAVDMEGEKLLGLSENAFQT